MAASNFPNDMNEDNVIQAGIKDRRIESSRGKSQLMSYLFRANYNLLDRYLFTFQCAVTDLANCRNHIVGIISILVPLRGVFLMKLF